MRRDESFRALRDCVQQAGAQIEFHPTGSGHDKATITLAGRSRFIILSRSPHGSNLRRALGDARRALRVLTS